MYTSASISLLHTIDIHIYFLLSPQAGRITCHKNQTPHDWTWTCLNGSMSNSPNCIAHQGTNQVAAILYKRCCVTQQTKHGNGTENIRNSCLDMTKLWMVLKTWRPPIYSHSTDGVRPWTLGIRQPVVGLSQRLVHKVAPDSHLLSTDSSAPFINS